MWQPHRPGATEKLAVIQEVGRIGFWECDLHRQRVVLDEQLQALYGYPGTESPLEITIEGWQQSVHPDDRPWVYLRFWDAVQRAEDWKMQYRIVGADGQIRHIRSSGRVVNICPQGSNPYAIGFEEDITDWIRTEQALQQQAQHDALTGTCNRRRIDALLDQERQRALRYNEPLSILLIDTDGFKQINDTYGHEAGDLVLHELVESCFRPYLRTCDHLGR